MAAETLVPAAERDLHGFIRSSGRRYNVLGSLALVVLFGGFGAWSLGTRITSAVIAPGTVQVTEQRRAVQHILDGRVSTVAVREGDLVQAGDLLLELDVQKLQSDLSVVQGHLSELIARKARLEAERSTGETVVFPEPLGRLASRDPAVADFVNSQFQLFAARLETLQAIGEQISKRSMQLEAQLKGLEVQRQSIAEQHSLISAEITKQQDLLEKGLSQSSVLSQLQRERAKLDGALGELDSSIAQAEGRKTELELERVKLFAERREEANAELREIAPMEIELTARMRSLEAEIPRYRLLAPVSGRVLGLTVSPGSVLRAAEPALYLVPSDQPLSIAARVAPDAVEEVATGQEVRLVFSSIQAEDAPELTGTVSVVSADTMTDQITGAAFFSVDVTLTEDALQNASTLGLMPGMPVDVFIKTGDQSPLSYLIKPFADYFRRAFRES